MRAMYTEYIYTVYVYFFFFITSLNELWVLKFEQKHYIQFRGQNYCMNVHYIKIYNHIFVFNQTWLTLIKTWNTLILQNNNYKWRHLLSLSVKWINQRKAKHGINPKQNVFYVVQNVKNWFFFLH